VGSVPAVPNVISPEEAVAVKVNIWLAVIDVTPAAGVLRTLAASPFNALTATAPVYVMAGYATTAPTVPTYNHVATNVSPTATLLNAIFVPFT